MLLSVLHAAQLQPQVLTAAHCALLFKTKPRTISQKLSPRKSWVTPSPPTKSFPTKSPRVELSGRLPIKFDGHENSHPLELRVCLSQTLWNPNS